MKKSNDEKKCALTEKGERGAVKRTRQFNSEYVKRKKRKEEIALNNNLVENKVMQAKSQAYLADE